jgi:hypothetical protein
VERERRFRSETSAGQEINKISMQHQQSWQAAGALKNPGGEKATVLPTLVPPTIYPMLRSPPRPFVRATSRVRGRTRANVPGIEFPCHVIVRPQPCQ